VKKVLLALTALIILAMGGLIASSYEVRVHTSAGITMAENPERALFGYLVKPVEIMGGTVVREEAFSLFNHFPSFARIDVAVDKAPYNLILELHNPSVIGPGGKADVEITCNARGFKDGDYPVRYKVNANLSNAQVELLIKGTVSILPTPTPTLVITP